MLTSSSLIRTHSAFALCAFMAVPAFAQVTNEDMKFLASDGATGDAFGHAIAIEDGVFVVGANGDDDSGISSGSAYIRHLILDAAPIKIIPNDGAAGDLFGHSVAIGMGLAPPFPPMLAVVGAPNDSDLGDSSGSAYLFRMSGAQYLKLLPNDGAQADNFGVSVAIDNGIVVVGAPADDDNGNDSGSAYLFDAASGSQLMKLLPNDGDANDAFGFAVSISNGVVAVSAPRHKNNGIESGSVYLFNASSGAPLGQISSNEGVPFEQFGYSLAIDNGLAAIGALGSESAYVYDTSTLARVSNLIPSTSGGGFGWKIDIDGNKVVVGSPFDPVNAVQSGSSFLFNAMNGTQLAQLVPGDGGVFEQFGSSIGIHEDLVVIGARGDNDLGVGSGSAYFFDVFCPADLNGDGILDFFDVSFFLSNTVDFNGDTVFDFFDVSAFLMAFSQGCP